jgi:hypothetical protein
MKLFEKELEKEGEEEVRIGLVSGRERHWWPAGWLHPPLPPPSQPGPFHSCDCVHRCLPYHRSTTLTDFKYFDELDIGHSGCYQSVSIVAV